MHACLPACLRLDTTQHNTTQHKANRNSTRAVGGDSHPQTTTSPPPPPHDKPHSCIVYERQPPQPQANAAAGSSSNPPGHSITNTNTSTSTGANPGRGGGSTSSNSGVGVGGGVSLLYPKRTSLAARIRTPDSSLLLFLSRLLALHPDARLSAEEALASPWLVPPPGETVGPPPHLGLLNATQQVQEEG
jgi:hypothetical protein